MNKINLIESFQEFKDIKRIDRPTMMGVIEEIFRSMIIKKWGSDENFDIIINTDKGDLEIWKNLEVVDDDYDFNPNYHIILSDARKEADDIEIGEELTVPVDIDQFGRRALLQFRQNLSAKINELHNRDILERYTECIGELFTGTIHRVLKDKAIILDDDGFEFSLPKSEQIPGEFLRVDDTLVSVIKSVEMVNNKPYIVISRSNTDFLERLFEQEIPEVSDGLIRIVKVVREAGKKSKVIVEGYDDRVDPVGACIGTKGSKIYPITKELSGESIDVINNTNNMQLLISRSLNPAKTLNVEIDGKIAKVTLDSDQIGKAVGSGGRNIRLASELTGYDIRVFSNNPDDDDVNLEEFSDEIDEDVINQLKSVGFDTAKSILKLDIADLVKRTNLRESTINSVREILMSEFE